jgi:hypothetical protein
MGLGDGVWNNNVASVLKARLDSSPSGENPWSWISMEFRRHRHNSEWRCELSSRW